MKAPGALRALLAFGLLRLIAPTALAGQEERIETPYRWIERSLRASAYGGYTFAERGIMQIGPGSTEVFGGRLRVRISSPLSLELNAAYGNSDRFVIDPRLETGPAPVDTLPLDWLLFEAAFQLAFTGARSWHGLQPYVLFGGGLIRGVGEKRGEAFASQLLTDFRFKLGTAPLALAGIGTEWLVSERVGIGFEARDQIWRLKTPDGFFRSEVLELIQDLGTEAPQESDWTHNLELTAGLWYYF